MFKDLIYLLQLYSLREQETTMGKGDATWLVNYRPLIETEEILIKIRQ